MKIRSSSASTWLYIVVTKVWKWRDQSCYSKHAYLIRIFLIISSSSFLKKRKGNIPDARETKKAYLSISLFPIFLKCTMRNDSQSVFFFEKPHAISTFAIPSVCCAIHSTIAHMVSVFFFEKPRLSSQCSCATNDLRELFGNRFLSRFVVANL